MKKFLKITLKVTGIMVIGAAIVGGIWYAKYAMPSPLSSLPILKKVLDSEPASISSQANKCKITANLSGVSIKIGMAAGKDPPYTDLSEYISQGTITKNEFGDYDLTYTIAEEGKELVLKIIRQTEEKGGGSLSFSINGVHATTFHSSRIYDALIGNTLAVGTFSNAYLGIVLGRQNVNDPCPKKESPAQSP